MLDVPPTANENLKPTSKPSGCGWYGSQATRTGPMAMTWVPFSEGQDFFSKDGLLEMDESRVAPRPRVPDVMVSYSSHDRERVMQFVQRLRAAGVAAWIDFGGIDGAQRWGEEIVNAIDACKTVILMISQTSMQSENIAKEVALAWEGGKHFLPLCLEDAKIPKSMQYQLAGIQHIKLYEGDPEAKFVAVLRALVRLGVRVSPYYLALVSADLGDREQAFDWLNRASEQRSGDLARLKDEPRLRLLHGDPRFAALVAHVATLTLEPEEASAEVSNVLPHAMALGVARSAGPVPLWKRILWPDIFNDRDARQAAAQGVWACAFVVAATIVASILTSTPGGASVLGLGWNSPIVVVVVFAPIGFGIQKMGRPAAVIGLVLCSFAALGNLNALQSWSRAVDNYENAQRQYQQYPQYQQYQNPYLAQARSQYYYCWFSLLISLACVGAFTNSTRGTFAYRKMVQAREARDKQDAITRQDWVAIKAGASELAKRGRRAASRARPASPGAAPLPARAPAPPLVASTAPQALPPPVLLQAIVSSPQAQNFPTPVAPAPVVTPPAAAASARRPVLSGQAYRGIFGVGAASFEWRQIALFALANIAGGLAFILWRSVAGSVPVPAGYWLFEICHGALLAIIAAGTFRFMKNLWAAAAAAAGLVTVAALPLLAMLPSFAWSDLVYREQFQQFLFLPFVSVFVLLSALTLLVPRLQPQLLALWLGAMGAEILTSFAGATLRGLGSRELPDPVWAGASVISALLRSGVFALVFWSGLRFAQQKSRAATPLPVD